MRKGGDGVRYLLDAPAVAAFVAALIALAVAIMGVRRRAIPGAAGVLPDDGLGLRVGTHLGPRVRGDGTGDENLLRRGGLCRLGQRGSPLPALRPSLSQAFLEADVVADGPPVAHPRCHPRARRDQQVARADLDELHRRPGARLEYPDLQSRALVLYCGGVLCRAGSAGGNHPGPCRLAGAADVRLARQ